MMLMAIEDIRYLLIELSQAPEINTKVSERLLFLIDKENLNSKDLESLLDDCAYYSMVNDFTIEVMETIWRELKKLET